MAKKQQIFNKYLINSVKICNTKNLKKKQETTKKILKSVIMKKPIFLVSNYFYYMLTLIKQNLIKK